MTDIDAMEAKIIKQVEYYFNDINLSRDKFMKQVMAENDGWISLETMLKFNRLKSLTEDIDVLEKALQKSTSGMIELGSGGIRRCSDKTIETFDEISTQYKDKSLYVKGFNLDSTLDEIIAWLEEHGGKTLNVHMRRQPKDKKFKGSVFVVFDTKEDAEKLVNPSTPPTFKNGPTIILYREAYWKQKDAERGAKKDARNQKQAAQEEAREAQVSARMTTGALLELSGLPKNKCGAGGREEEKSNGKEPSKDNDAEKGAADLEEENSNGKEPSKDNDVEKDKTDAKATEDGEPQEPTVLALKQWLIEKLGTNLPIAWVDVEPTEGKAVVRFKTADSAEQAWNKLKESFGEEPVVYSKHTLSGRVVTGDEEKAKWRIIMDAQLQKAQKRRSTGRQGGRGGRGGGYDGNKRRRMH